jgi:predicted F0F1-ATPase subunit
MSTKKDEEFDLLNSFALLTQIGLTLAIPIIIGIVAGELLDSAFGDGHVFLFSLLAVGLVVGFYAAYRELKRVNVNRRKR